MITVYAADRPVGTVPVSLSCIAMPVAGQSIPADTIREVYADVASGVRALCVPIAVYWPSIWTRSSIIGRGGDCVMSWVRAGRGDRRDGVRGA